jgi:hypothetical protein
MALVVTITKGYDLGYVWKNQGQAGPEQTTGGYYIYINAAQAGEPPGRWWGPGGAGAGALRRSGGRARAVHRGLPAARSAQDG